LLSFATGALALEQPVSGIVVVGGVKHSSSDNKWQLADRQYGLEADLGQKLLQFAFWDIFFGLKGAVAEDRASRYILALSVAGGSKSRK
jgi:hypothetical protein